MTKPVDFGGNLFPFIFMGSLAWTITLKILNSLCPSISKKNRLLKFCYVPATNPCSYIGILGAATNSTSQTNMVGSM